MPVNAKGRLKYLDLLSMFSSKRAPTPLTAGSSAKAQRGSSVPEISDGSRPAVSSPIHDLKAGLKAQSHPCVSPPLVVLPCTGSPSPQTPLDPRVPKGQVTEKVTWEAWGELTGGSLALTCLEGGGRRCEEGLGRGWVEGRFGGWKKK